MRKRFYGNNRGLLDVVGDDNDDDEERQRSIDNNRARIRRTKQALKTHRRSGSTCFVLGVIVFCFFQAMTFVIVDKIGTVDDDDDTDGDRSMFGLPNLLSALWNFFSAKGPLRHAFSPGYHEQDQLPLLIIGGSDGSGTRAFVDTIRELGAVVVADDPDSFDIHATQMFRQQGWPGLINAVLNFTHTADYEWEDLIRLSSESHANLVRTEIINLYQSLRKKYDLSKRNFRRAYEERLEKDGAYEPIKGLSKHRSLSTRKGERHLFSPRHPLGVTVAGKKPTLFPALAKGISFVVKAPVSMLVLPLLAKFYGNFYNGKHIKFLHVVRDGRDVALSSNQSPVLKFYQSTYPDYVQREGMFKDSLWNVRAMQLWNDWNTQVYNWATRHQFGNATNTDVTVDYLWMRSEDLLPGSPRRLECLQALAEFVGSTLTTNQLCILSQQDARDYGKSVERKEAHEFEKPLAMDIRERWKQIEKDKKKGMKKRHQDKHQPHQGSFNRRLSEVVQAKIVPSGFVEDFEVWKALVASELGKPEKESKAFVLSGLIGHGNDLREQWNLNSFDADREELKQAGVDQQVISVLVQQLQTKLQETRLFNHRRQQNEKPIDPNVTKRYGKWQAVLSNNTELSTFFYREGGRGLGLFGYHPARDIYYLSEESVLISDCEEVETVHVQG